MEDNDDNVYTSCLVKNLKLGWIFCLFENISFGTLINLDIQDIGITPETGHVYDFIKYLKVSEKFEAYGKMQRRQNLRKPNTSGVKSQNVMSTLRNSPI